MTLLHEGDYAMGPEWDAAHQIAQAHEGDALFDRIHAIVHRIEGDEWNADYWYRRAGLTIPDMAVADEIGALRENLS
ncbi:hypothetical protein B7H23_13640 [Notoacmeibacter marinus]|uniref:Uncharacterized protein n=1 Tax=Notoacmeibacter marinus TaxID=1876515 RepID=A0A231UUK1_9HYPH|nr:hypothetical protein B7H23_13640 [Notoacmeibacter marinus]